MHFRIACHEALQDRLHGCDDGVAVDVPVVSQEILDDDPVVADLLEAAHGRIECMEGNSEAYEEQRPVRESSAEERRVAAVSRPSRGAVAGRQFKFGSCPTHGCARSAHVFSVDAASERRGRAFVCLVSRMMCVCYYSNTKTRGHV